MEKRRTVSADRSTAIWLCIALILLYQLWSLGAKYFENIIMNSPPARLEVAFDPAQAKYPSICTLPPGKFTDGKPDGANQSVAIGTDNSGNLLFTSSGDLYDPETYISVAFVCSAGTSPWPHYIVLYSATGEIIDSIRIDEAWGTDGGFISSMESFGSKTVVRGIGLDEGDPTCCGTLQASAWLSFDKSGISVDQVYVDNGLDRIQASLDQVNEGEGGTEITTDAAYAHLSFLREVHGSLEIVRCYRTSEFDEIPRALVNHIDSIDKDISLLVEMPTASKVCEIEGTDGVRFLIGLRMGGAPQDHALIYIIPPDAQREE